MRLHQSRFCLVLSVSLTGAVLAPGCVTEPDATGREIECGNDFLEDGELCDSADKYCSEDCMSEVGRCGDGIIQTDFGEACEPDGLVDGDGNGGAGGEGGMAASTEVKGCSETCQPMKGYVCDPESNTCGQTGIDADALVEDHLEEVCAYFIGLWGGTGNTFVCETEGDPIQITAGEVEECVEALTPVPGCTVGELEAWTLGRSRCEIATGEAPCLE